MSEALGMKQIQFLFVFMTQAWKLLLINLTAPSFRTFPPSRLNVKGAFWAHLKV